jgi:hypothetical protein
MKTNLDLARLLVRKAESDLADVRRTLASVGPYDTGLFHCQQAVEKYLKARWPFTASVTPRSTMCLSWPNCVPSFAPPTYPAF